MYFQKCFLEIFHHHVNLVFYTRLSHLLLYQSSRDFCCEIVVFVIKRSDHKCSTPLYWEIIEVRPRQVSVLACVVLAGISEGLTGLRVLEGARCRCCAPSDLAGSILLESFIVLKTGT